MIFQQLAAELGNLASLLLQVEWSPGDASPQPIMACPVNGSTKYTRRISSVTNAQSKRSPDSALARGAVQKADLGLELLVCMPCAVQHGCCIRRAFPVVCSPCCSCEYMTFAAAMTLSGASRTQSIMQYLQQSNPNTEMILMAILPRANLEPSTGVFQWPNKFTKAIESVNSGLAAYASTQAKVHHLDCAKHLVPDGKVSCSPLCALALICIRLYTTYGIA